MVASYSDIIRLLSIRSHSDENADYAEKRVDQCPPGEVGVRLFDIADDGGNEGDQPGELCDC